MIANPPRRLEGSYAIALEEDAMSQAIDNITTSVLFAARALVLPPR